MHLQSRLEVSTSNFHNCKQVVASDIMFGYLIVFDVQLKIFGHDLHEINSMDSSLNI